MYPRGNWSHLGVRLDKSSVTVRNDILDVRLVLLGLFNRCSSNLSLLSLLLFSNLGNPGGLLLELLLVSFGLLSLSLLLLELSTLLSDFLDQEFVLSLDSVGLLS